MQFNTIGKSLNSLLRLSGLVAVLFIAPLPLSTTSAQQAADQRSITDLQQLIQRIKQELMQELLEGEFLQQQIELGIQDYIEKQQQAQVAARTDKARLANKKSKHVRRVSSARDPIYGDPDKEIVQAYAGQVNLVYRHFPLGTEFGLGGEKFRHCLDSGKYTARVQEDITEGAQIDVTGTPANILLHNQTGETRVKTNAQPLAAFKTDIDEMLN